MPPRRRVLHLRIGHGHANIGQIAGTYHAWRGEMGEGAYEDVAGFCRAATLEEIRTRGHVLTPGRYVGAEEGEADDEPFEEKMARLWPELVGHFEESKRLQGTILANLTELGFQPDAS